MQKAMAHLPLGSAIASSVPMPQYRRVYVIRSVADARAMLEQHGFVAVVGDAPLVWIKLAERYGHYPTLVLVRE
jgi:hypothetical protein